MIKLTKAEKAWLVALEKLFLACPSKRIGAYTVGDDCLYIYDKQVDDAWMAAQRPRHDDGMDASEQHSKAGSELGRISTGFQIDSCAG